MEMLLDKASVKVSELAQIFDVSIETIRRDLDFLGKQGRLIKVYGGAILEHVVAQEVNQIRSVQNAESTLMEWCGGNWNDTAGNGTLSFLCDGTQPNGQTLSMAQPVFAPNAAIDLNYGKASENDVIGILKRTLFLPKTMNRFIPSPWRESRKTGCL